MLEKTDKKIGIFNQRVKKVYSTWHISWEQKIIYGEKTLLIFTFSWSVVGEKKHTMEADWLQIAWT